MTTTVDNFDYGVIHHNNINGFQRHFAIIYCYNMDFILMEGANPLGPPTRLKSKTNIFTVNYYLECMLCARKYSKPSFAPRRDSQYLWTKKNIYIQNYNYVVYNQDKVYGSRASFQSVQLLYNNWSIKI